MVIDEPSVAITRTIVKGWDTCFLNETRFKTVYVYSHWPVSTFNYVSFLLARCYCQLSETGVSSGKHLTPPKSSVHLVCSSLNPIVL